ncbi:MAG: SH3 domain-containing protein [Sulfurospirillum sp.]|nr:SH3 domain-containing protein [Sulfurospirillum sp.]
MKQLLIIPILALILGCGHKDTEVLKYEQKTDYLITNTKPLHVEMESFNSREFMPWAINSIGISKESASWANVVYRKENRYYAENILPWDLSEIDNIIKTTNFEKYNQNISYAITTKDTQVRNLPTFKPFYLKTTLPGEGFPFDYMQTTLLHVNTPLLISHYSNNGAWAFVQNPVTTGWLPRNSFALLDAKSRNEFKNSKKIVITEDNIPIYSDKQKYIVHAKLGSQFPLMQEKGGFFYSYMYTRFANKIEVRIPKTKASNMPLEFNKTNLLNISSELLGEKYGWGGYLQNRDCSAMTKDFLAPFGLWLPRNSAAQKSAGEYISFKELKNKEKERIIIDHGVAFLSLIYLKGHIMLYVGEVNNRAMVMHNVWGIKTETSGKESRHVIGKTVISDLHVGENLSSVKNNSLLIDRVEGLVIEPKVPIFTQNIFVKAYPSIVEFKENILYFDDNSTLVYHDYIDKTTEEMTSKPSIKDTISQTYKPFTPIASPTTNAGKFRNDALLRKLYGNSKQEVTDNLIHVEWVDGSKILFNQKQNASRQLRKVVDELKKLPKKYDKFLINIAGTFQYEDTLKTDRLNSHSLGIAIDIHVKQSNKNKIPKKIVDIFETYGFIWGGRWHHHNTMYFEYRPELFYSID